MIVYIMYTKLLVVAGQNNTLLYPMLCPFGIDHFLYHLSSTSEILFGVQNLIAYRTDIIKKKGKIGKKKPTEVV